MIVDNEWLEQVRIRLIREEDLPLLEWNGEYSRYRRIYAEVYHNFTKGISLPFVAETDADGIIGQVFLSRKEPNPSFSPRNRYYFLSSFRVKPAFRDRGLGDRLIRFCEDQVRQHRLRDIYLNCSADNRRARYFYEAHGFRVVRYDESTWTFVNDEGFVVSEPQKAYLMKKTLPRWFFK